MAIRNPRLTRIIRQTLYGLKKKYGVPISVYRLTVATTDYETGVKTATKQSFDIRLGIILPSNEARRFLTSISFIAASKAFVSPGAQGWDQSLRGFVIDGRDLPNFEFEPEDWIVYRGKRYEATLIKALELNSGWFVLAKETKGNAPEQIINLNLVDTFNVAQSESETVE